MATKFSGAEWMAAVSKELSPFGALVADILGQVYVGIYHIQDEVLNKRVEWMNPSRIEIITHGDMSTYDFDYLTKLVVLCHDHAVRFTVAPATHNRLRLIFHKRSHDELNINLRHPTMEEAVSGIRERIGLTVEQLSA